jgi:hypothetical protein
MLGSGNHIIGMLDDMHNQRVVDGLHDEYGEVVNAWQRHAGALEQKAVKTQGDLDALWAASQELLAQFQKLAVAHRDLLHRNAINARDKGDAEDKLRAANHALKEAQRDNAMNYAEKKVYAAFAREMRNVSGVTPVFEPLLYSGDRGNWIRERIRLAAVRVFNAGGSIHNSAEAAIREMHQHVQFVSPSSERLDQIDLERAEIVVKVTGEQPGNMDVSELAQKCPDVRPA